MAPMLHTWLTAPEAVATFGGDESAQTYLDGQFVVLPSVVLCFVTTGHSFDEPHVSSPSQVVWRPEVSVKSEGLNEWLPEKVREVWDQRGTKALRLCHHLFLRTRFDEQYFYAGEAHLGSYGSTKTASGEWGLAANFSLNRKLPRDVWIRVGGYPGWQIEVNHQCHRVETGDLREFERLVGEVTRSELSHLCITRYEEDLLTVHTNAARGWLMYLRYPFDGGMYTRDLEYSGPADAEELFRCRCGLDLEVEAAQTLPRELAQRAALEFFHTGRLPECVHWDSSVVAGRSLQTHSRLMPHSP